jgi:hypothetical protein
MKQLDKNWLTTGLLDFEYKQYILLAYLQEVKQSFSRVELYPYLSDLVFHYQNLHQIKQNKQLLFENFPKEISQSDFEQLNLYYTQLVQDDALMKEMEDIILFAIPQFQNILNEGKDIYDFIEQNLEISPIGLSPLSFDAGYFFISEHHTNETQVYEYQVTFFESANEKYRGVHTQYIESFTKSFSNTYENAKIDLIRRYRKMPNPATYLIHARVSCPLSATLLPIAKRLLVKYIS